MKGSARPDVYDKSTKTVYDYKFLKEPKGKGISASQRANNKANLPKVNQQIAIEIKAQ